MNLFADFSHLFKRVVVSLLCMGVFCSCIMSKNVLSERPEKAEAVEILDPSTEYFSFDESDQVNIFQSSTSIYQSDEHDDEYTEYVVRRGDTLMLIAFHMYGDYLRWREIYELNRATLGANHDLNAGMLLKLSLPLRPHQRPMGLPYLIKSGDSLSLISRKVYGDLNDWPRIWQNNPTQIRDPNLIFAGFTLFYPERDYFMNEPF